MCLLFIIPALQRARRWGIGTAPEGPPDTSRPAITSLSDPRQCQAKQTSFRTCLDFAAPLERRYGAPLAAETRCRTKAVSRRTSFNHGGLTA